VTRAYDSLSHLTRETSTIGSDGGKNTNWLFGGSDQLLSMTYPSGHNLEMVHDALGRVQSMTSSGPGVCSAGPPHAFCATAAECGGGACVPMSPVTTTYHYLGPDRVTRRDNGNGTWTEIGYDGHRRVDQVTFRITPADTIDDRTFTWDDAQQDVARAALHPGRLEASLLLRSASRMVHSLEERPGQPPVTIDYALDGANTARRSRAARTSARTRCPRLSPRRPTTR
jgi:YD repeat-containing protein